MGYHILLLQYFVNYHIKIDHIYIVGTPLLKGGDQLSKIGNQGGDKITLSKKGGQMKKRGGGWYMLGGISVFLLVFCR